MVPEIWSAPDIIFCHFRPFFALLPLYGPKKSKFSKKQKKYLKILSFSKDKSQSYDIWFLRYGVQWTECFVILGHFCPFTPLTAQKIKILKKWIKMNEKKWICTKNYDQMMYASWDMVCVHMCTRNYDQMMYGSWDMHMFQLSCFEREAPVLRGELPPSFCFLKSPVLRWSWLKMLHIYELFKSIKLFTNSIWKSWLLMTILDACVVLVHHLHHQLLIRVNKSTYYFGTSERGIRNEFENQCNLQFLNHEKCCGIIIDIYLFDYY